MKEIWFARRFPVGQGNGLSVTPVSWKGYAMFGAFAAAMIVGASGFIAASFSGQMATGVFFFVSMALFGAGVLFVGVLQHSDNERTAADYRAACAQTNARNTKRA